ncbi:L-piperidine-6-carboxylate dehydrogenase [Aestuariivivens insulae]|uniref:L-piperidine-6-carboxylate dehydrogenase n=1 Tax=Aestuariivivens insulae TaxID=1621988 RepID=UPI001F59F0EB|nr:aldehyde dehydrogenase family protein [Aestuariivivens insulae]
MKNLLKELNLNPPYYNTSSGQEHWTGQGKKTVVIKSPVDDNTIGSIQLTDKKSYEAIVETANSAFKIWKAMPAPQRGEIVRQFGDALRKEKENLGKLVSYEMGKSLQEGYGEVQEMIDICDFAVGLSRQLYGLQMHSERPNHRMFEQWHPLGIVGIISAFNFPVAVWAWNAALAWVCGNVCIWKPSEKTPFSAIACQEIFKNILKQNNLPEGISNLVIGDSEIGKLMASDQNIALVSATGSTRMGKDVAETVGKRLGKSILELGGNNAIIVTEEADLNVAIPAIVFGAVGTAGQRCTTTRRLIVHKSRYQDLLEKLKEAYKQLNIGDPLNETNHVGPLIDTDAVKAYLKTIEEAQNQGGQLVYGNKVLEGEAFKSNCYVTPTIIEANINMEIVKHETFAPILYVFPYDTLKEAIAIQNNVPQGLSSAIFSQNMQHVETFLSNSGSDCGIANVNIGTSGAEIGGAFGGEKETGGGRESGSDSWKAYMRRQTCTINYGKGAQLAQGIIFNV